MNSSLSSRRPCFNASFGSPQFIDRTIATKRIVESPFYKGRTIYGGASAYTRRGLGDVLKPRNMMKPSVQIKPSNEPSPNGNASLSKTAQRILDTLEQYSSPLLDVQKIPLAPGRGRTEGILTRYTGAQPYLRRDSKTSSNTELQVPTLPSLIKMKLKEKLQDSTESMRQMASTSKSFLNEYSLPHVEEPLKHTNKIKNKITSVRQRKDEREVVPEVILPNAVLPITTLPKFDFTLPPCFGPPSSNNTTSTKLAIDTAFKQKPHSSKAQSEAAPQSKDADTEKEINTKSAISKPNIFQMKSDTQSFKTKNEESSKSGDTLKLTSSEPSLSDYKFSPFHKSTETKLSEKIEFNSKTTEECSLPKQTHSQTFKEKPSSTFSVSCPPKTNLRTNETNVSKPTSEYTFAKPLIISENRKSVKAINNFIFSEPVTKKTKKQLEDTNLNFHESNKECLLKNIPKKINGESVSSQELKSFVMDANNKNAEFGSQFKLGDKWECDACMVRNDSSKNVCVSCTTPRPTAKLASINLTTSSTTKPIFSKNSFGDQFKKPSDTWECTTCMVQNKNSDIKCVACTTSKPVANKSNLTSQTWECSKCLIKNSSDKLKCDACSALKSEKPLTNGGFGNQFKLGLDKWECAACMVRNNTNVSSCVSCTTPRPNSNSIKSNPNITNRNIDTNFGGQFKTPVDTWECPTCMIRNSNEKLKCIACESAKPAGKTVDGFNDKFKMKESEWECASCMVRNSNEKLKCSCCEAPKPGSQTSNVNPVSSSKSSLPSITFGIGGSTTIQGFTFGIKPDQKLDVGAVKPSSIFGDSAKTESSTPQTFSFGIKKSENNVTSTKDSTDGSKIPENPINGNVFNAKSANASFVFGGKVESKPTQDTDLLKSESKLKPVSAVLPTNSTLDLIKPNVEATKPIVTETSKANVGVKDSMSTPKNLFETKPLAPAFQFGGNGNTNLIPKSTETKSTPGQSTQLPTFGSTFANNTKPLSFGNSVTTGLFETKANTPSFGAASTGNKSVPVFGSGATSNVSASSAIGVPSNIGMQNNADGSMKTTTPTFGAVTENKSAFTNNEAPPVKVPTFSFGQTENKPASIATPAPTFNFSAGSNVQANTALNFGVPTQPTQNGSFNFGQNVSAAPKTGFNFGSNQFGTSNTGTNVFSFGNNSTSAPVSIN